ncbi:MAG: DUF6155 family protein [Bacteroidota bacterium]
MKRDFLKLVKSLEDEELREELKVLYERFPAVREYYQMELSPNTQKLLAKYKKAVRKAFFPSRGRRMGKRGRSESRKAIKEFATISIHSRDIIELKLYRVAVMIEAISYFRVVNESFHDSIVKSFAQVCAEAEKEVMLDTFRSNITELVVAFEQEKRLPWFSLEETYAKYWEE